MKVPTTLSEALIGAASWLDVGDKAFNKLQEERGNISPIITGDGVQVSLRKAAEILEKDYPQISQIIWDKVLEELPDLE